MEKNTANSSKQTKKIARLIILLAATMLFTLSIFLIFLSLGYFEKKEKELILSYQTNNNLKYKVYLKENNFIEEPILGMNETYISELIDHIEINYNYLFSSSKSLDLNYDYIVDATIYGEYQTTSSEDSSQIWSKKYTIEPDAKEEIKEKSNIENSKTINLDLTKYQEEVINFQKELKLPMTSKLVVRFTSKVSSENPEIISKETSELTIPLNEKVFSITKKTSDEEFKNVYDENTDLTKYINTPLLIVAIILTLVSLYFVYIATKSVLKVFHRSEYIKNLTKIKKDYDEIIVDLSTMPDIDEYQLIEVETFEELMDLEEEVHVPILHYETIENKESIFIIIYQNLAYRYILR